MQRDAAARVITNCVRAYPKVIQAKKIQKSLRQLAIFRGRLARIISTFQRNPFGYRANLYFVDQVEKIIFQLDDVPHYRNAFVRAVRKQIVTEAQAGIAYADVVMKTLTRKARKLSHIVHNYLVSKDTQHREQAARVIQRTVRAYPQVRQAKQVRAALSALAAQNRELAAAAKAYKDAVEAAKLAMAESKAVLSSTNNTLLSAYMAECEALVNEPITQQPDQQPPQSQSQPQSITSTPASSHHDGHINADATLSTDGQTSMRSKASSKRKNKKRKHKRSTISNKRPTGQLIE
jgi:hypothetical protein